MTVILPTSKAGHIPEISRAPGLSTRAPQDSPLRVLQQQLETVATRVLIDGTRLGRQLVTGTHLLGGEQLELV